MPRPHEIAADARALYGPLALRPSAQEAGDGALWVDPSAEQPLTQVQSGNWVSLAPTGVPVLRGPYVVDYTDIPTEGSTMPLWTPQAGDVLLRLFGDPAAFTNLDNGRLAIGQNPAGSVYGMASPSDPSAFSLFDAEGNDVGQPWALIFPTTDPVEAQLVQADGTDPGAGHWEIYALVARAVAP